MCGRRVEGWRGLLPVGELDLGGPPGATSGQGHAPVEPAAPREVGQEEPTRPIRPSASLAAASASSYDEESRRTTGEVPSVGHEVRAKAPDQRVHTSPIGNVLPTEVLQSLDAAAAANSRLPIAPDAGRHRSSAPGAAGGSLADGPSSSGRPTVPMAPGIPTVAGASGRADRPSSPDRVSASAPGRAASPSSAGQRSRDSASAAHAPSGERLREPPRPERDLRHERSTRRISPRPRRPERSELPALSPSGSTPVTAPPDPDSPRHPAPDAPQPIGFEPTHFIARRQSGTRLVRALRTLIWALLWLGLGGAVAFSVVAVVRRNQPAPLPPPVSKPAPPRRTPPTPTRPPSPAAPRGPAAALPSSTRAHDLVVPIPAAAGRPVAPARPEPGAQLAPSPPAPSADPPPVAPAVAPAVAAPEPPLDPQEQAAAEHTMSNIEFVVSERVAQVRACYERAVRSLGPDAPGGRIEVSVTLSDEGQATRISTIDNTVGNAQLAGCLEQRIAEWRFPRPLGLARTFRLPFTFSPSPQQSGPRSRR